MIRSALVKNLSVFRVMKKKSKLITRNYVKAILMDLDLRHHFKSLKFRKPCLIDFKKNREKYFGSFQVG